VVAPATGERCTDGSTRGDDQVAAQHAGHRRGEVFGGTVAAALIDRLVHHAEVHPRKGGPYRMRGRDLDRIPTPVNESDSQRSTDDPSYFNR
jgi:hypothetical protein